MPFQNSIKAFVAGMKTRRAETKKEAHSVLMWKILVAVFFGLTALVLISSYWVYQDIGSGEFSQVAPPAPADSGIISKELLDKTVKDFGTKAATFEQIQKSRGVLPDPSI